MAGKTRTFGSVRPLPSGRIQSRYSVDGQPFTAPRTFKNKTQANKFLASVEADLARGTWQDPTVGAQSRPFGPYATIWLRQRPLGEKTRSLYQGYLERAILPFFGDREITEIDPPMVREFMSTLPRKTPTSNAATYSLLKSILATAIADEIIKKANPCQIKNGHKAPKTKVTTILKQEQVEELARLMPARYYAMTMVAAYTCLRFGELTELRRSDYDGTHIQITRAVASYKDEETGETVDEVKPPKSDAGVREIPVPEFLRKVLAEHLLRFAEPGGGGLIFPAVTSGGHMKHGALYKAFGRARRVLGRTDFTWHDLRHTGAVMWALDGATTKDLMTLLGHETPEMAMHYQHIAEGRLDLLAERVNQRYLEGKRDTAV